MSEILIKEADTILDEPVFITVDIKPFGLLDRIKQWLKIKPKKQVFSITGATLRTMIRISKLLLSITPKPVPKGMDILDYSYELIEKETEKLARIIAAGIHNQKSPVPESLVELILDNFTAKEIKSTAVIVIEYLNVVDFISTINSIRSVNILEMSLQNQEEIIASGEQSAE